MARKNPFAGLMDDGKAGTSLPAIDYAARGASRSLLNSIDEMAARADRLVEGEAIVDLDPGIIDASFVQDRLASDGQDFSELLEAIRARGQDSPILVRPHPDKAGRFMVVFGHRRLRAATELGRKVRAVVKALRDEEHVIAQGQENSARANLSFIEKAFFAANLARLHLDTDQSIILTALAIDRATLSKMLSVAALPVNILKAIGPAKAIGRDRWYALKLRLEKPASQAAAIRIAVSERFAALSSDERFTMIEAGLKIAGSPARARSQAHRQSWAPGDGSLAAEITADGKRFTLALKARGTEATAFGDYLSENLDQLYKAFRQHVNGNRHGD